MLSQSSCHGSHLVVVVILCCCYVRSPCDVIVGYDVIDNVIDDVTDMQQIVGMLRVIAT